MNGNEPAPGDRELKIQNDSEMDGLRKVRNAAYCIAYAKEDFAGFVLLSALNSRRDVDGGIVPEEELDKIVNHYITTIQTSLLLLVMCARGFITIQWEDGNECPSFYITEAGKSEYDALAALDQKGGA